MLGLGIRKLIHPSTEDRYQATVGVLCSSAQVTSATTVGACWQCFDGGEWRYW